MAATVPGGMRRRQSSTGFSRSGNGQSAAFWWTGCGGLALRSMFVLFLGVGPGGRGVPVRGVARGAAGVHAGMRMPGFTRECRGSWAAEAVQEEGGGCPCPCPSPSVPVVAPCPSPRALALCSYPSPRAVPVARPAVSALGLSPHGVLRGVLFGSPACSQAWFQAGPRPLLRCGGPAWSRTGRNAVLGSGGPGGLAVLADRRSRQGPADPADPADLGSHHRAVRLTARWYDELVRLPWHRSVCGRCAAGIGRCAAGRGKRARRTCPMCDFPLPAHRETAPCGMLWITFVHIPGPSGTGDACGGIDGCDRSDPCRGGQAGPRRP